MSKTDSKVWSALLLESQQEVADLEEKLEQATARLLEKGGMSPEVQTALDLAERAVAAAEAVSARALEQLSQPIAAVMDAGMQPELEKARTSETAALIRVATAEGRVAQMGAELAALRNKPAAPQKRGIRSIVRERDPNGHARVVDTEILQ